MKIGIDISQLAYPNTGVANYLQSLVESLLKIDSKNEYILFFAGLRGQLPRSSLWTKDGDVISDLLPKGSKVTIHQVKIPPTVLDILWNRLHIIPIEKFIGNVDIFITSDWTEPPVKNAKKVTVLYDLVVFKRPEETDKKIIETQKRKLKWVKKESSAILCISEATKKDAMEILNIPKEKLFVVYPGF